MRKTGLASPLLKKPGFPTPDFTHFQQTNLVTVSKIVKLLMFARLNSLLLLCLIFVLWSQHAAWLSVKIINDILQSIDWGSIVALVSLDISAAFDTVNLATLLARLRSKFGVTHTPLSWTASYRSGRSFFICVSQSSAPVRSGTYIMLRMTYVAPIDRLINDYSINMITITDMPMICNFTSPSSNHLDTTSNALSIAPLAFSTGSGRTTFSWSLTNWRFVSLVLDSSCQERRYHHLW